MDYSDLINKLLEKNTRAAARLITLVENDIEAAETIINSIYKHTGDAYILGITGAPGSGKSTFISTLTDALIKQGKKIGIICVDPTSPLTGGALLGDRIRMKQHFNIENVFIRSMANRGQLGGLARATEDVIKILDAYGCEVIIIETVGVGQSEVDIFKSAQTVIVLLVPGMGDEIQAIKAGIMEITDIFVVNKMDLHGADRKVAEITQMLELNMNYKYNSNKKFIKEGHWEPERITVDSLESGEWVPEIIKINSKTGENFEELHKIIEKHRRFLENTGFIKTYKENRIKTETIQILKHKLTRKVEDLINNSEEINSYLEKVIDKSLDPYSMANLIMKMFDTEKK